MKLLTLKAHNFWSYRDIDFVFDKKLCLIEGFNFDADGSNGSGKSGLLNAVCFALFGKLPKNIRIDDVVNEVNEKDCTVVAVLEENGTIYEISRGRKPNLLKFEVNGQKLTDIDTKKTQTLIEQHLGFTFDTFVNSAYFPQNLVNFLYLNDESKKDILTELLQLYIFDKAHDIASKRLDVIKAKALDIGKSLQYDQSYKKNYDEQYLSLRNKSKFFDSDQIKNIESINSELNSLKDQFGTNELKIKECQIAKENTEKERDKFLQSCTEQLKILSELESTVYEKQKQLDQSTGAFGAIRQKSVKFNLHTSNCPTCFQEVNFNLLDSLKKDVEDEATLAEKKIDTLKKEVAELPSRKEIEDLKVEVRMKQQNLNNTVDRLARDISSSSALLKHIEGQKRSLDERKNKIALEVNPYDALMLDMNQKVNDLTNKIATQEEQLVGLVKETDDYDALKEVFSNKGVKSYVFDNVVNELNVRVNQYLGILFDRDFRFNFLSETQTLRGTLKNTFSTQLLVNNAEVPIGRLSGGEERRLAFAINLALGDLISARSKKSFNVLFLDEVFDGIDDEGKSRCMDLLRTISDKKDCIMVIDHSTTFKMAFDTVIKIEKRDGISRIVNE